jgi:hypothetical protein
VTSGPSGVAACTAVGLSGLLFHDLRRSGARNYRRTGVTEDVIVRVGGWKTKCMSAPYNVVDERDLTEAAERLAGFLADAASAPPTIVPLARSTPPGGGPSRRTRTEHGQSTPVGRCSGQLDGHKLPNSIRGEGRGPVASPVFKCGDGGPVPSRRITRSVAACGLWRCSCGLRPSPTQLVPRS